MSRSSPSNASASATHNQPTPLWAVMSLTFLASIGTGVVWNGVSFIAKHDYEFESHQTLWLYAMLGVTYVIGAMSTGRVLRAIGSIIAPRTALGLILLLEAITCVSLKFVAAPSMLWLVAGVMSILSSWVWPIVESYLTAGRHGRAMRQAIGWWNMSWTVAVALAMVMMMPVMRADPPTLQWGAMQVRLEPRLAIVGLGLLHAVAIIPLMWFGRWPGAHDETLSTAAIQQEYPLLLRAARMLLPLSYVLNAAIAPLMPYILDRIELQQQYETALTSIWMWVRVIAMGVMWQMGFWHGRWGTLLMGGLTMSLGFGLIVMSASLVVLVFGLAIFGIGMGIVYYAALYYAMAVGRAEVDAGGTHEALIGAGYTIGPLTGLIGVTVAETARDADASVPEGSVVVALAWTLIAIGGVGVLLPYLKARRLRKS